jgi:polysaccharide biosynthesis protein PslH
MGGALRVLMPSIVDAGVRRGGAWTATRGLLELFRRDPWNAQIVSLVPPEPAWRRARQAACLALAPWTGMPAKVLFAHSRAFRERVRRSFDSERFDLLLINGSDLLWCQDEAPPGVATLAVVHNCESDLYADQVAATVPRLGPLHRLLLAESARLLRFEIDGLRRARAAIFLSSADAADFAGRLPELDCLVVPPLFTDAPQRAAKEPSGRLDLGLLANFQWWPNRDAVDWFLREILDRLPADVSLHLFGAGSASVAARHPRVVAHGFVDDLREVWRSCDWMLSPIRYGSGVSVKTAECIYHGMPMLSTSFGLRGLPAIESPQIVVRESAREWVSFLSSSEARTLCRERLPLRVSRQFAPDAHADRFDRFLSRLVANQRG